MGQFLSLNSPKTTRTGDVPTVSSRSESRTDEQVESWLGVLQASPCAACALWESYPYNGGSLHPDWEGLLLLQQGSSRSCLRLKSLDPVQVFVGPQRLTEALREELLRPVKMISARWHLQPTFKQIHCGACPKNPLIIGISGTQCPWDPVAKEWRPSLATCVMNFSHKVSGAWYESQMNTLVLEMKRGTQQRLLFMWVVRQLPLAKRLHPLVLSFLDSDEDRWVYVLASGYKFKGRGRGAPIDKTCVFKVL